MTRSVHIDRFAADRLPPRSLWPEMDLKALPEIAAYPERMNAADWLLDLHVREGRGDRACLYFGDVVWTYAELKDKSDRIARVLVEDLGLVPGNRVLLRAPNNPMLVACWFGVLKAGGICVTTMPLLRARELVAIGEKGQISHALVDARLDAELAAAAAQTGLYGTVARFTSLGNGDAELDRAMAAKPAGFETLDTAADDLALIAFTSGTTGAPKGTMHFHRDVLAICDCFPKQVFGIQPDDIMCGSPPLGFTFGLGALVLFPMRVGAASVLLEQFSPEILLQTVEKYRCTAVYTAPTGYRTMAEMVERFDLSSLRKCVSAGEYLPRPTFERWREVTGISIIDGLGSTEILHIFVSTAGDDIRPGATGKAIPGYQAKIVDAEGKDVPDGTVGRMAVRGPTGCRYLDDEDKQRTYVQNGWNITGDVFLRDADGYFWYQSRADDLIISAGYNIAGPEVENALLDHPAVKECAVIGIADEGRGQIVKAFIVLRDGHEGGPDMVKRLQDHVKAVIAPYKYPRSVEFVAQLPRTETGKLQRFRLREPGAP